MEDMVILPKSDWVDILDGIKEKSGTTEKLKSGEVRAVVDSITTGGGSGDNGLAKKLIERTITTLTAQDLSGITTIAMNAFYNSNIENISFPDTLTTIGGSAFIKCSNLRRVVFGSGIKSIGVGVFSGCTCLEELDFSRATVIPSLANINAFLNVPSTCVFKIPYALYDEWKFATNWSDYADYMVAV